MLHRSRGDRCSSLMYLCSLISLGLMFLKSSSHVNLIFFSSAISKDKYFKVDKDEVFIIKIHFVLSS